MTSIYVSPNGLDTNTGSIGNPLKTVNKAISLLIEGQGGEIILRDGEYRETISINKNGTINNPIIIRGYEGENIVINGCDSITGWSLDTGLIYKANMNWTIEDKQQIINGQVWGDNQIFYKKKMMVPARWPSISPEQLPILRSGDKARAGNCLRVSSTRAVYEGNFPIPNIGAWDGARINYWGYYNNVPTTGTVISATNTQIEFEDTFLNMGTPYNPQYLQPSSNNFFYLWGKKEFLTDNGEWYRSTDGTLFLWPDDEVNPEGFVEAKRRLFGIILNGNHIHIENIKLFACAIQTTSTSNNCRFENIRIDYTWHIQELYRLFWTFNKLGCRINGKNHSFYNCSFFKSATSHMILEGEGHTISDCIFVDSNYEAGHSTIFSNSNGIFNNFERCTFSGTGGHHIRIGKRTNYKYCYFEYSHRQTSDLGVFHSWSIDTEGSEIAYNIIRNNESADYNPSINNYACCGLLIDHCTFNISIYRNIIYIDKSSITQEDASKAIVVLGFKGDVAPIGKVVTDPQNVNIFHNSSNQKLGPGQNYPGTGISIGNNIFLTTSTSVPTNMTVLGNWESSTRNPRFYGENDRDFRLTPSSPLINKGANIPIGNWSGTQSTPGALESNEGLWLVGTRVSTEELDSSPIHTNWDKEKNILTISITLPLYKTIQDIPQIMIGDEFITDITILQQGNILSIKGNPPITDDSNITLIIGSYIKQLSQRISVGRSNGTQRLFSQTAIISQTSSLYSVRLNSSSLINAGKLDRKCKSLRLFGPTNEPIDIWIDSPNTEHTLVWFKSPSLKTGDVITLKYPYSFKELKSPSSIWSPTLDNSSVLWLRANQGVILDSNEMVEYWLDTSFESRNGRGDTYDGNVRTPLSRPSYISNGINGLPSIAFNGSQGLDIIGDFRIANNQPRSIIIVLYRNGSEQEGPLISIDNNNMIDTGVFTGNNGVWSQGNDRLRFVSNNTYSNSIDKNLYSPNGSFPRNATLLLSVISNTNGIQARLNGNPLISNSNPYQHYAINNNLKIGRHQLLGYNAPLPQQFKGRISEVLLFDRDVSDLLPEIERYLSIKYLNPPIFFTDETVEMI